MSSKSTSDTELLLHACCGPCSLEPIRLLREEGIEPTIFYANPNIAPEDEYERRLSTIENWASDIGIAFIEDEYDPQSWADEVGIFGDVEPDTEERKQRCRACYRLRFEATARYAKEHGFKAIGTTLSVSPYQYTDLIEEELMRAAENHGLEARFVDYSPFYGNATARSLEMGMYRQKYCGCAYSKAESERQRKARDEKKRAEKERRVEQRAEEYAKIAKRKEERAAYDEKQARKRAILKQLRENAKHAADEPMTAE